MKMFEEPKIVIREFTFEDVLSASGDFGNSDPGEFPVMP